MQRLLCYWNSSDMEVSRHVIIFFLISSEARTNSGLHALQECCNCTATVHVRNFDQTWNAEPESCSQWHFESFESWKCEGSVEWLWGCCQQCMCCPVLPTILNKAHTGPERGHQRLLSYKKVQKSCVNQGFLTCFSQKFVTSCILPEKPQLAIFCMAISLFILFLLQKGLSNQSNAVVTCQTDQKYSASI